MRDATTSPAGFGDPIIAPSGLGRFAAGKRRARTPAGLQRRSTLFRRRVAMAVFCATSLGALLYGVATVLGAGGWTLVDALILSMVALSAPWTILGFWNAAIGFALAAAVRDPVALVAPFWRRAHRDEPIRSRTAVLLTLRNEDPERALRRALALRQELDRRADGAGFDLFILSDTSDLAVAAQEEALFERHRPALSGLGRAIYRRRLDNAGFKAGNVRDFLDRWGAEYDFFLPLDADSAMSAACVRRLVRVMERHPRIGILQSLVVGAPSDSAFARLFQFGMRHGMRSFTLGSAWWQGDCGPFWGHNAVVRADAFAEHCRLPTLPGRPPLGGPILSHDQLEAALMRRAGYEVRVAPVEDESWEDNPVSLLEFIRRERRWLNGNMQYVSLLGAPGLKPVSRFQLVQAVMMYLAPAAWMGMTALAAAKLFESDFAYFDATLASALFFTMLAMSLAPKLAGVAEVALRPGGVASYGGPARFAGSASLEIVFGALTAPAVAFSLTTFFVGLLFGRRIGSRGQAWAAQERDAHGVPWSQAIAALWPQKVFGLTVGGAILATAPEALPWAAPVLLGLILAAPIAVATSSPRLGRAFVRLGVARIPEETTRAPTLTAIASARLA